MKRKLAILLVLVMSLSMLLIGCAGSNDSKVDQGDANKDGGSTTTPAPKPEEKAWKPSKDIEWVVTSSPGGGSDIYTRMIADIMKKENFVEKSFLINNQTDGGGEVGRLRVSQTKDDGHMLLTFNSGDLMPMVQNTPNRIEKFKPIAIMAVDRHLMLKGKNAKYADLNEAIEAAKSGTQVIIGGSKGDDVATYNKLLKSIGLTDKQMGYIMYDATSEALTALLGGHLDFAISKPAASMQYIESKDMIPVVALAKEHFEGVLADAPLLSEIGNYENIETPMWRGVVAPASTPDEAIKFWSETFKKISETETWKKDYIEKNLLTPKFMPYDEATKYMKDFQEESLQAKK